MLCVPCLQHTALFQHPPAHRVSVIAPCVGDGACSARRRQAGSPLGMFMAVRKQARHRFRAGLNALHAHGTRLYNVYHRCDPIAGRLEGLTMQRTDRPASRTPSIRRTVPGHDSDAAKKMFRAAASRLRQAQVRVLLLQGCRARCLRVPSPARSSLRSDVQPAASTLAVAAKAVRAEATAAIVHHL